MEKDTFKKLGKNYDIEHVDALSGDNLWRRLLSILLFIIDDLFHPLADGTFFLISRSMLPGCEFYA